MEMRTSLSQSIPRNFEIFHYMPGIDCIPLAIFSPVTPHVCKQVSFVSVIVLVKVALSIICRAHAFMSEKFNFLLEIQ